MAEAPPAPAVDRSALEQLRRDTLALDVEDILALCFAFSRDPQRLLLYLDVLRRKPGPKAQGAACMICFDLARRGDRRFEDEFIALLPVVRGWLEPGNEGLLRMMLGNNAYLHALWGDLQSAVAHADPRIVDGADIVEIEEADAVEVALLDATDFDDIGLDDLDILTVDDQAMQDAWQDSLNRFCATLQDHDPVTTPTDGFYADDAEDLRRLERLRSDAVSLSEEVADARGMVPIINLFLAAHTRAKNLFGRRNRQRDAHLREGLIAFCNLPEPPEYAVTWLCHPTSVDFAWEKVAEILLDFTAFASAHGEHARWPEPVVDAYLASNRPQPPPQVLAGDPRERRRR